MQKPAEVMAPEAKRSQKWSATQPSITIVSKSFDQVPSVPLHLSFYASLGSFLRFCFCVMLLGVLSSISLSHKWRKCFIWYEATYQHLFFGLICSLFPFLFSSTAGSFSVNSNNTSVLSVPAILFHECQNPALMNALEAKPITYYRVLLFPMSKV